MALGAAPNTADVWRRYLSTREVDAWGGYEKIPEDQRSFVEKTYGFRKLCAALASGACTRAASVLRDGRREVVGDAAEA